MINKKQIMKMIKNTDSKSVEEMTKKELIELVEIITDAFIEVYNDNITLSDILHDLWTPLYEISFTVTEAISILKSKEESEE